jgi:beta-lactamase regulating signal transducer with metallopeptidase domain
MGYRSEEISITWIWIIIFAAVAFFLYWAGTAIYFDQKQSLNPEIVKLQNERKAQEAKETASQKEQYIEGCKAAGKSPTDMGDNKSYWECTE